MPDEILAAGEFLENRGYRFLKDFGTSTAVDRAALLMTELMEKGDEE